MIVEQDVLKRFRQILEHSYNGNLGKMADDIGVDRATCSRYKNGLIPIPRRSILAISRAANIDLSWLESGGGEEIKFDRGAQAPLLPVLRDPTDVYPAKSIVSMQTPSAYFAENNYWLDVKDSIPGASILERDYVLIQPLPPRSLSNCDVGRLLAVRHSDARSLQLISKGMIKGAADLTVIGQAILVQRRV